MSWTNDNVLEFLDLYRREQHLWDPQHPLHRNRNEVAESWNRIQASLSVHCSVNGLKKKKESLMTSFRMHLAKKKSQDGYRITWFAYPLMESFLSGKYECDSTNHLENEFFSGAGYCPQTDVSEHTTNLKTNIQIGRQNKLPTSQKNIKNAPYPEKRVGDTSIYLKSSEASEDLKVDKDEYDLYGQLLAKKLRKLDEHERDLAMHEIDNIMFRAKMQNSTSQIRNYTTSTSSPTPRKLKSPVFIVAQHDISQYHDENNVEYQEQPPS